jgi:hypothetical protein
VDDYPPNLTRMTDSAFRALVDRRRQAANVTIYNRQVLVDTLVEHAMTDSAGCRCGGVELGHSYPEHLADMYERRAALR